LCYPQTVYTFIYIYHIDEIIILNDDLHYNNQNALENILKKFILYELPDVRTFLETQKRNIIVDIYKQIYNEYIKKWKKDTIPTIINIIMYLRNIDTIQDELGNISQTFFNDNTLLIETDQTKLKSKLKKLNIDLLVNLYTDLNSYRPT
jgi:phosphate uptake regulator